MGFLDGLLGHATEVDLESIEKELEKIIIDDERVEKAFKVIRDLIVFTNYRLILIDKQGMTGKKIDYHSIPYKSISHFSIETAGHFDLDAELKLYISSHTTPIEKHFRKEDNIYAVQKALSTYIIK